MFLIDINCIYNLVNFNSFEFDLKNRLESWLSFKNISSGTGKSLASLFDKVGFVHSTSCSICFFSFPPWDPTFSLSRTEWHMVDGWMDGRMDRLGGWNLPTNRAK